MELVLKRIFQSNEATTGVLFIENEIHCFTLEDKYRIQKLKGKTRIPEGMYEIKEKKKATPLTEKYRDKFTWFFWHLELQNVPDFENVYIHIGNTAKDTDGCILVGREATTRGFIKSSTKAFYELYMKIIKEFQKGERVFIKIENEVIN